MKLAWIAAVLLTLPPGSPGGDEERGLKLLEAGSYAEAAMAFRAAIEADGPRAELCYNLALALWRAGDLEEAEIAAEKAATLSDGRLNGLRDGILGNLRYAKAVAAEAEDLQAALKLAEQARDHYLRGATDAAARPELARNLERSLVLIEELRKKLEEQEKQEQEKQEQEQQDQQEQDENQQDEQEQDQQEQEEEEQEQKEGEPKEGEQDPDPQQEQEPKQEPKQQEDPESQGQGQGEEQGEPQPQDENKPEQNPEPESQPEQQQEQAAPGEQVEGKELTPEQKQRLMDKLEKLQEQLRELRMRQKAKRPKVKKDW